MAAMALTIGLRARSGNAPSNINSPTAAQLHAGVTRQPSTQLLAASLPAAMVPVSAWLADATGGQASIKLHANPDLPPVEEFTLTPLNPALKMYKTIVSVRFPELPAERLASQIPMTLGDQNVVLQRSADDGRIFSATVDFDWNAFAREQQQRKDLASSGKVIPVFQGRRLLRMDKIEFVDPADIESALQSHQPIQFSSKIMEGAGFTIEPEHELTITDLGVVTDATRTWDSCSNGPTGQMGPWTFGRLVTAMTGTGGNQTQADAMVNAWLNQWLTTQTINSFPVAARTAMANIISAWPKDNSIGHFVDVSKAPFQLNAIVNRIDLGPGLPQNPAGEVRFVFGLCSTTVLNPFNVILEYGVPSSVASGCTGVFNWATEWHNLDAFTVGSRGQLGAEAVSTHRGRGFDTDSERRHFGADSRLAKRKWEL
jgi:hypothetical protein